MHWMDPFVYPSFDGQLSKFLEIDLFMLMFCVIHSLATILDG